MTQQDFAGVWACQETPLQQLLDSGRFKAESGGGRQRRGPGYELHDGVALVMVGGVLTKYGTLFGSSTLDIRGQLRAAVQDEAVQSVLLLIDSPGGSVAGTADLAATIQEVRQEKPVAAFIEDLGASAAYWLASQAQKVYANQTALAGSIGTYAVIADYSKLAEDIGLKVHVIKAGEFKGAAVPGTKVTDEQLAEFQRTVNAINEQFLLGVAAGRGMALDRVRQLADGRVHVGKAAKDVGLVDEIASVGDAVTWLRGRVVVRPQAVAAVHTPAPPKPVSVSPPPPSRKAPIMKAKQEWNSAIKAKMDKGMLYSQAARLVNRENPGLRQRMLQEVNAAHGRPYAAAS